MGRLMKKVENHWVRGSDFSNI